MSFEPPAIPPSYPPAQPQYQPPAQPQYGNQPPAQPQYQPPQPQYGNQPPAQQPNYTQPPQPHPGYGQQPQQNNKPPRAKNPLGLTSAILGASGYVLMFIFTLIQLGIYSSGSPGAFGVLSGVHTVLDALLGLGAVALGVVSYLKGGPSKLLAIVGTILGITLLLSVLNSLIFTIGLPLMF